MSEPATLTKSSFAARHGVAKSRVTEWTGEGLPVTRNGRISVAEGDAWIASRLDPARRAARKGGVARAAGKVADQRARKLDRENALLDLELARKRGALIDRAATLAALADFSALQRDAWIGWVARTAPALAAAGSSPAGIFAALDRAVREHLGELARLPMPEVADAE